MRRRSVILTGFAALLLPPEHASAQQPPAKIPRVGILSPADSDKTPIFDAFRQGLRDLGWVEGRNIILEFRLAHGDFTLLPGLAEELVNLPVDVVVSDAGLQLLAGATRTIPIVAMMGDPMLYGLVASLSRPGGNVTGFTLMHRELSAKRLELLRTAFSDISAVAVLRNPSNPGSATTFRATEEAARSLGLVTLVTVAAGSADDLLALARMSLPVSAGWLFWETGCSGTTAGTSSRSSTQLACPPSTPSESMPTMAA
jgi:putative ABC transport system substrate-binding protein